MQQVSAALATEMIFKRVDDDVNDDFEGTVWKLLMSTYTK